VNELRELAHFLYGRGFWYTDPAREVKDLDEEQLFWVPSPRNLPALWHVGHIAHRERTHVGMFLQGLEPPVVPEPYEVFGTGWVPVEEIRAAVDSVDGVLSWVREVREASHAYIESLAPEDFHRVPEGSEEGLSVLHWLVITAAHAALHIGRIQVLRNHLLGQPENPC
jgi:hypothetical protein